MFDTKTRSDNSLKGGRYGDYQIEVKTKGPIYDLVGDKPGLDLGLERSLRKFNLFDETAHYGTKGTVGEGRLDTVAAESTLRSYLQKKGYSGIRIGTDGEVIVWNPKDLIRTKK